MDDPNFAAAFARAEAEWLIEPICGTCGCTNPCSDARCELAETG